MRDRQRFRCATRAHERNRIGWEPWNLRERLEENSRLLTRRKFHRIARSIRGQTSARRPRREKVRPQTAEDSENYPCKWLCVFPMGLNTASPPLPRRAQPDPSAGSLLASSGTRILFSCMARGKCRLFDFKCNLHGFIVTGGQNFKQRLGGCFDLQNTSLR